MAKTNLGRSDYSNLLSEIVGKICLSVIIDITLILLIKIVSHITKYSYLLNAQAAIPKADGAADKPGQVRGLVLQGWRCPQTQGDKPSQR
jgi:hypothetical protein